MSERLRILLVEDNPGDADLIVELLPEDSFGAFEIECTPRLAAALERVRTDRFDLVLLDLGLPDSTGLDTIHAMRQGTNSTTPIVVLTGNGDERMGLAAIHAGAQDYAVKGQTSGALLSRILRYALERHQDARRLRESEEKYRAVVDKANDGIIIAQDGVIKFSNPGFAAMLGHAVGEVEGVEFTRLIPPENTALPVERHQKMLAGEQGVPTRYETVLLHKNGGRIHVEVNAGIIQYEGRPADLVITRDITERKRAEEALRKSKNQYDNLVSNIPVGVYIIRSTPEGAFAFDYVSPKVAEMFNVSAESFLADPQVGFEPIHPDDLDAFVKLNQEQFQQPQPFEWEGRAVVKGAVKWLRIASSPEPLENGDVLWNGIVADITDRKRVEQALAQKTQDLERSNTELEHFAYVASHDLQEPLRMVSGFMGLLAERYQGQLDADADEFIGFAIDGAQRMQRLISGLLDYSRVGTRGQPFEPTAASAAVDDALWNLELAIQDAGATVTRDPLPTVMADRDQLMQLFQNLIGNAVKFRGTEPPRVHVSARETFEVSETSKVWLFSVRDNGIGIALKDFGQIFDIFQRLHSQAEYPGTGIGLATCKKIVERHGGRIWVESEPGQGSSFCFTLPAQ